MKGTLIGSALGEFGFRFQLCCLLAVRPGSSVLNPLGITSKQLNEGCSVVFSWELTDTVPIKYLVNSLACGECLRIIAVAVLLCLGSFCSFFYDHHSHRLYVKSSLSKPSYFCQCCTCVGLGVDRCFSARPAHLPPETGVFHKLISDGAGHKPGDWASCGQTGCCGPSHWFSVEWL